MFSGPGANARAFFVARLFVPSCTRVRKRRRLTSRRIERRREKTNVRYSSWGDGLVRSHVLGVLSGVSNVITVNGDQLLLPGYINRIGRV